MLQGLRGFISRHRRKVFLFTALAVCAYYFYQKVYPYLSKLRMMYKMMRQLQGQEQTPQQLASKARDDRRKFAEKTVAGSEDMVAADMVHLHTHLQREADLDSIKDFRKKEKEARDAGKDALKSIYSLLKFVSFTYAVAGIYVVSLHDLVKRMQIAILAHHQSQTSGGQSLRRVPLASQRAFLQLTNVPSTSTTGSSSAASGHLVGVGLDQLVKEVRQAVERVVGPVKIRANLKRTDIGRLIGAVRSEVEAGDGASQLVHRFMLPSETTTSPTDQALAASSGDQESQLSAQDLLNELRDIIDGPDFDVVLHERLNAGFQHLEDKIKAKAWSSDKPEEDKVFVTLLPATQDAASRLFKKEEERKEALARINEVESNRDFFVCVYWGGDDDADDA